MAREPADNAATGRDTDEARSTVFENLGIDDADLAADAETAAPEGQDDERDEGGEQEQQDERRPAREDNQRREPDDLRVSHTRQDGRPNRQDNQRPGRRFYAQSEVKPDAKGNLVGPDGRVVATAGREARYYQESHRAKAQLQSLESRGKDLQGRLERAVNLGTEAYTELERYKAQEAQIKSYNLQPNEYLDAMQMAAAAKTDPIGTIKKLLTRAAANGIDLTQLGLAPGGIDAKSLMEMIRTEIGNVTNPLVERNKAEKQQQEQQRQQQAEQVKTEAHVRDWFGKNEAASEYAPIMYEVLKQPQFSHMSLDEIWVRIQLNLERRSRQQPNNQRQQNTQRRSPPAGRGTPFGGQGNGRMPNQMAPISAKYDTILNDVLNSVMPN